LIHFKCPSKSAIIQFFLWLPTCTVFVLSANNRESEGKQKELEINYKLILAFSNLVYAVNTIAFTTFDENWSLISLAGSALWYATNIFCTFNHAGGPESAGLLSDAFFAPLMTVLLVNACAYFLRFVMIRTF
jgi:hypothetical protein